MEQVLTCINCPIGCRLTVHLSEQGQFQSVDGYSCPRGAVYARQECTLPQRMLTAVIPVEGKAVPLSVKTSRPVPKAMIRDIMSILSEVTVTLPVQPGQVIIHDVLGTGADIIATRTL